MPKKPENMVKFPSTYRWFCRVQWNIFQVKESFWQLMHTCGSFERSFQVKQEKPLFRPSLHQLKHGDLMPRLSTPTARTSTTIWSTKSHRQTLRKLKTFRQWMNNRTIDKLCIYLHTISKRNSRRAVTMSRIGRIISIRLNKNKRCLGTRKDSDSIRFRQKTTS